MKTHAQTSVILRLTLCILLSINLTAIRAQTVALQTKPQPTRIAGKPISFYLNHNAISSDAKLYFEGKLTPSDDTRTFAILDSAVTRNAEVRPFYFFLLNQMMKTADGAFSEYVSTVCSRYFSQYPCEFITWQTDPAYEISIHKWADFIAFDLYTPEALKKYAAGLKTGSCPSRALDNFLNDLRRIVTELNEH